MEAVLPDLTDHLQLIDIHNVFDPPSSNPTFRYLNLLPIVTIYCVYSTPPQ